MPYTYITFGQLKTLLAQKLLNSAFWNDTELGLYLIEALRTWNSLTNFQRIDYTLPLIANQVWYNLATATGTPRSFNVTDNDVLQLIELGFLEPPTPDYPLVWSGSSQFSINDLLNAIQRRRDELLSATGCTITQRLIPAPIGRAQLPDTVIDVRRVAWIPNPGSDYSASSMTQDDQMGVESFDANYTSKDPSTPETYRQSTEPPITFDVNPQPAVPGQYDVLSIDAGSDLSSDAATLLGIPDDFMWVIKYGAMEDLLAHDGNATDQLRSKYCGMRYRQGLAIMMSAPAVLNALISDEVLDVDSVQNRDNFSPGWQAAAAQRPDGLLTAGLNMLAMSPPPDDIYEVVLKVVQNFPIPTADGDSIQLGRDSLDAVLDLAQHIASFKMGGAEFLSTIPLLKRFHDAAALYNSKINELGEFSKVMYQSSKLQVEAIPVYSTVNPASDSGV